MSRVRKFYGYTASRTHPFPFILFSFRKRLPLWTDITRFWGRTLIWIHCTYFGRYFEWTQNATAEVDSKLSVFLNGKAGDVGFYFPLLNSYRHEKSGINTHFFPLYRPMALPFAVNAFTSSWPHLNGRQSISCLMLEYLCCLRVEPFSRFVN